MNRTAPATPITTTVSALSDRRLVQQLKELTAVEHQLEVVVIDHLRELERRRLYLSWGFSSLFDYATSELGYSEAAAWRRIKAMRLCGEVEGARERMRDGSLTLNSAALLQNAFDRQERKRKQSGGGRGARGGDRSPVASNGSAPGPGMPPREHSAPAQAGERAEEPSAAPVLDSSARRALVEEAAGKSTRQVENLLAGVDPELAAPADRIRPLGAGRWEIKAVIDDDCRLGLEQLKGLLSHVDAHLTLGSCWAGWCGKRSSATTRPGSRVVGAPAAGRLQAVTTKLRRRRTHPGRAPLSRRNSLPCRQASRLRRRTLRATPSTATLRQRSGPAQRPHLRRRRNRPGRTPQRRRRGRPPCRQGSRLRRRR